MHTGRQELPPVALAFWVRGLVYTVSTVPSYVRKRKRNEPYLPFPSQPRTAGTHLPTPEPGWKTE